MKRADFYWLVGWLEGEASFFMGKEGNTAIMQAFSTDRDVINKVARLVGSETYYIKPRKHPGGPWMSSEGWRVHLESKPAVDLMKRILPFMGKRRKHKINEVLHAWNNRPNKPTRKLCACGCGRKLFGGPRLIYARRSGACAQAAYRQRQQAA